MITIADYAKSRHISYEAARKQVVRYEAELADHVTRQGRKQYLDEEAVRILDQHREPRPIIIEDKNTEREQMADEISQLKKQLAEMQMLQKWYDDSHLLLDSYKNNLAQLTTTVEGLRSDRDTALEQAKAAQAEKDAAVQKAHSAELEAVELRAKLNRLKSRGLIQRILNKDL